MANIFLTRLASSQVFYGLCLPCVILLQSPNTFHPTFFLHSFNMSKLPKSTPLYVVSYAYQPHQKTFYPSVSHTAPSSCHFSCHTEDRVATNYFLTYDMAIYLNFLQPHVTVTYHTFFPFRKFLNQLFHTLCNQYKIISMDGARSWHESKLDIVNVHLSFGWDPTGLDKFAFFTSSFQIMIFCAKLWLSRKKNLAVRNRLKLFSEFEQNA